MKIVSRIAHGAEDLQRIRDIIEEVTDGAIGPNGTISAAADLSEIVTHIEIAVSSLCATLNLYDDEVAQLSLENSRLVSQISKLDDSLHEIYSVIENGVDYDEDLDHATIDMMEAFIASGATEPTFDGEISFSEKIIISKEDLKPIVRQAIDSWLRLKVKS